MKPISMFILLAVWVVMSSCSIVPRYSLDRVEYCKKVRGYVQCDDGIYDAGGYGRGIYE